MKKNCKATPFSGSVFDDLLMPFQVVGDDRILYTIDDCVNFKLRRRVFNGNITL